MKGLVCALAVCLTAVCAAQAKYTTRSFNADFVLRQNGNVDVRETIAVRFNEPQHGLIRIIPYSTKSASGQRRAVSYQLHGIEADQGSGFTPVNSSVTSEGGDWRVRIGSRNVSLTGAVTYRIRYTVTGALTPINNGDALGSRVEFLWNLLPTGWKTDIEEAKLRVSWPEPKPGRIVARVLAGTPGTRTGMQVEVGKPEIGRSELIAVKLVGKTALVVDLKRPLPQGSAVTADIALPRGTVSAPSPTITAPSERLYPASNEVPSSSAGPGLPFNQGSPWLGLLPFVPGLIVFLIARRLWLPRERPLVVRFDPPPGMGPSLCGTIIDGEVHPQDIIAGIVSLAQRGALRLHHTGKREMEIELLGLQKAEDAPVIEQELYQRLSGYGDRITSETLRGSFSPYYQALAAQLRQEAVSGGFFRASQGLGSTLGCFLAIGTCLAAFLLCAFQPVFSIAGMIGGLVLGFFAIARIPYLTAAGQEVRRDLQGLREFITRAHRQELNYMADREPDQALFERLLPYAIAFGAVKQWTQAFEGIDLQMPSWYDSPTIADVYWVSSFLHDMSFFSTDYGQALVHELPQSVSSFDSGSLFSSGDTGFGGSWHDSGSSGGGFDGGFSAGDGGGGGGGDSW